MRTREELEMFPGDIAVAHAFERVFCGFLSVFSMSRYYSLKGDELTRITKCTYRPCHSAGSAHEVAI